MRHAPAAIAAALLCGCGQPLLSAQLEIPEIRVALQGEEFPALTPIDPQFICTHAPADPPPPDCVARALSYDLGEELPVLDEDGAEVDLRLTGLALRLVSGGTGHLRGVMLARLSIADPATGGRVLLASYARADPSATPSELTVSGDPNVDLGPYLRGGALDTRIELLFDPMDPPGAFTASVEAAFSLIVTLDYGAYL
jgi:hypothetical protein